MKKSDLRTGMIVTLRNGKEYVFFRNFVTTTEYSMNTSADGVFVYGQKRMWMLGCDYNNNLLMKEREHSQFDVMKVEMCNHPYCFMDPEYGKDNRKLIWERQEAKKMTVSEIEAILGYKIEVVSEK
jgi:hypothetical protein